MPIDVANPYLKDIYAVLPRLLGLFDQDPVGGSPGLGDRLHWAWGVQDFGNATYQGAVHGLARLWRSGLWPYPTPRERFLARIETLAAATGFLTGKDGSLQEALPREGSYCVTALVAFDLLCALELLEAELSPTAIGRWREIVSPLAQHLIRSNETHAFISNHLATAAAALARWHDLTGDPRAEAKARFLWDRILAHQSVEGWFEEYGGADPGYQSLCTYYLADLHRRRPEWGLREPLRNSVRFLTHFAHPDGSFGGTYGSRSTRLYVPAGFEALADEISEAREMIAFLSPSVVAGRTVTLAAMDDPNLVPMFNAWCWAATLWRADREPAPEPPCRTLDGIVHFPEAGLVVAGGPNFYTIVSTHKGGVMAHFQEGQTAYLNAGVVARDRWGRLGSSQALTPTNLVHLDGLILTIRSQLTPILKRLPTPAHFLILRLLCLTVFRFPALRNGIKQLLVKILISPPRPWPAVFERRIELGPEVKVQDHLEMPAGFTKVPEPGPFVAIHMASQGYWQVQDEMIP